MGSHLRLGEHGRRVGFGLQKVILGLVKRVDGVRLFPACLGFVTFVQVFFSFCGIGHRWVVSEVTSPGVSARCAHMHM